MNILYYCDEYPPAGNGGIGTVVKLVAEAMSRRGHNVVVVGKYWNGKCRETIEHLNGVTIIRWHKGRYYTLAILLLSLCRAKRFKQFKAQLVFSRTQYLLEKTAIKYSADIVEVPDYVDDFLHFNGLKTPKWTCSVPRIIRVHGSVSFLSHYLNGKPDHNKTLQDSEFFCQSTAICAVSQFSKDYVTKNLCQNRQVNVIYNPIDENWFKHSSGNDNSQTILYFGKIAEMKGAFNLIQAFNRIAIEFPHSKLKLIGSGNIENAKRIVDPAISDRVLFSGFIPQPRIMEEIDQSAFCVLPSYFENFSMAALEVLARRKALVYTSRASGPELIEDGVNGFLIDPDDIDQLAERIRLLLSDDHLRNHIANEGYEMCKQKYSTTVIIPQIESYYKILTEKCNQ